MKKMLYLELVMFSLRLSQQSLLVVTHAFELRHF